MVAEAAAYGRPPGSPALNTWTLTSVSGTVEHPMLEPGPARGCGARSRRPPAPGRMPPRHSSRPPMSTMSMIGLAASPGTDVDPTCSTWSAPGIEGGPDPCSLPRRYHARPRPGRTRRGGSCRRAPAVRRSLPPRSPRRTGRSRRRPRSAVSSRSRTHRHSSLRRPLTAGAGTAPCRLSRTSTAAAPCRRGRGARRGSSGVAHRASQLEALVTAPAQVLVARHPAHRTGEVYATTVEAGRWRMSAPHAGGVAVAPAHGPRDSLVPAGR